VQWKGLQTFPKLLWHRGKLQVMKYALAGLLYLVSASGQMMQSSISASGGPNGWSVRFGASPPFGIAGKEGAPYSAVELVESVQTLADGGTIRRTMPEVKIWRDSQGRMRTERPVFMAPVGQGPKDPPVMIEILDPVSKSKYVLDEGRKVVHRQEMAEWKGGAVSARGNSGTVITPGGISVSGGFANNAPAGAGQPARPDIKTEQLPPQMIEGVMAEGKRQTMTWPVGSQGNDQPLVTVNESWFSQDLGLPVLTKTRDPRNGEHTRKLVKISRSEPEPGLFQPPAGWTVVEEAGEFTIQYPRSAQ